MVMSNQAILQFLGIVVLRIAWDSTVMLLGLSRYLAIML
jgi:hypothetical protein